MFGRTHGRFSFLLINIAAMDETEVHGHRRDNDLLLIVEIIGQALMLRNRGIDQV